MTKHTPGPWTSDRMFITPGEKDRRSGFIVNGPDDSEDDNALPVRICDLRCSPESPFAVADANARLIAAAPELLAAVASFLRAPSNGSDGPGTARLIVQEYNIRRAWAAYEKATGQNTVTVNAADAIGE